MSTCRLKIAALTAALVCVSLPARAQTQRVAGPFQGLFGGGQRVDNSHSMDVRGSVFGVWNDVVLPSDVDPDVLDPRFQKSTTFGGASGSLDYFFNRRAEGGSFTFGAHGGAADYSVSPDQPQYDASLSTSISTNLTRRLTFAVAGSLGYAPYYSFSPFAGAPALDAQSLGQLPGFAAAPSANINEVLSTGLTYRLSQRSSLSADFALSRVTFVDDSANNTTAIGSHVAYTQRITRRVGFHVGYQRTRSRLNGAEREWMVTDGIDAGLDYGDSIRLTRRTTLSFATSVGAAKSRNGRTQYTLLGSAGIGRGIGRTWSARADYARTLGFVAGFRDAVLSDSVSGYLGGQLARRISWTSGVGLSRGQVGLGTTDSFVTQTASSGLNFGLTRRIGAYVQYTYYRNRLPMGLTTLPILSAYSRNTVTTGLSIWQSIFNTERGRRDSR